MQMSKVESMRPELALSWCDLYNRAFLAKYKDKLLTYPMMQNIIWKADGHSAYQKNPAFFMETEVSSPCSQ
jgi:hypothetical protein